MKKLLLLLIFITFSGIGVKAQQLPPHQMSECESFSPYGLPQITKPNTIAVCRKAYVLLEDTEAKIPVWVAYTLTPEHALGCLPRINAFAPDQSLPVGYRSELVDYAHSGYDTGHIANDADMSWDEVAEKESFILSNMTPQSPSLNRGIWKVLETAVRAWVFNSNHSITIYAGPIYDYSTDKKIGPNNVDVPHAFFKIVIDNTTKQTLAFIFPHEDRLGKDLQRVQSTVADVEKATGISFFVPGDKTNRYVIWPIDVKERAQAKKTSCSIK